MIFALILLLGCTAAVLAWGERALIAVLTICWVQNIVLPWWYTQGLIDERTSLPLILLKEMLLILVAGYAAFAARGMRWRELPAPIKATLAYGAYVLLRALLGATVLGEGIDTNVRFVRNVIFPAEAMLVAFVAGAVRPRMRQSVDRWIVGGIFVAAVAGLVLLLATPDDFWRRHANIALFNLEVKGDPEYTVVLEEGVSGSGLGRGAFSFLARYRLIGTFGDPLTAGFNLAFGACLLLCRRSLGVSGRVALVTIVAAVVATFSRSSWIFTSVVLIYTSVLDRRFGRVALAALALGAAWVAVAPLRDFVMGTLASFSGVQDDEYFHAEAVRLMYSSAVFDPANLLGRGPQRFQAQTAIVENGFLYMMYQYGLPLLALFLAVCVTTERYLRRHAPPGDGFCRAGAAFAVASVVVSNFSFYALAFTTFFAAWLVMGLGIGATFRERTEAVALDEPAPDDAPPRALEREGPHVPT
jgi:hypothetical protein